MGADAIRQDNARETTAEKSSPNKAGQTTQAPPAQTMKPEAASAMAGKSKSGPAEMQAMMDPKAAGTNQANVAALQQVKGAKPEQLAATEKADSKDAEKTEAKEANGAGKADKGDKPGAQGADKGDKTAAKGNDKGNDKANTAAATTAAAGAQPVVQPANLPSVQYVDAQGEKGTLSIQTTGENAVVTNTTKEGTKDAKEAERGDAYKLADKIDELTREYLKIKDKPEMQAQAKALLADIRAKMDLLKAEMAKTRGEDLGMVQKRLQLEQALGAEAMGHPASTGAATHMATAAWNLMAVTADPTLEAAKAADAKVINNPALEQLPQFKTAVEATGMKENSGFFGAVGKSYATIKAAMLNGNLREKVQHVINWGNAWATQVFETNDAQLKELMQKAGLVEQAINKTLEQKDRVVSGGGKKEAKSLYGDTSDNDQYEEAKKSEMDRKLPTVPLEVLDRNQLLLYASRNKIDNAAQLSNEEIIKRLTQLQTEKKANEQDPKKKAEIDPGATGKGESNPLSQSERKRGSIEMSEREEKGKGAEEGNLPFLEGMLANLVDSNNFWIKQAREMEMPLKAGISGTTHRFMNLAQQLGADLPGARLAMIGHLLPTNAHSFHEVMVAANGPLGDYQQGKYIPLRPLDPGQIRALAARTGAKDEAEKSRILGL